MENQALDTVKRLKRIRINKKTLLMMTIGGGAVFWLTSVATSLLPIAAAYRAAFSDWNIRTVWIGSLITGLIFGYCVSYLLLRFFEKLPAKSPILKSVILSSVVLIIAVILIDIPMFLQKPGASLYYQLIGIVFNTVRFLFLGIAVGFLYKRIKK